MPEYHYNDNGTIRQIKELHYNDNGVIREIQEGWYNDNGVWRLFFIPVPETTLSLNRQDGVVNTHISDESVTSSLLIDSHTTRELTYQGDAINDVWSDILTPVDDWECMVSLNSGDPLTNGVLDTWQDLNVLLPYFTTANDYDTTFSSVLDVQIRQKSNNNNIDSAQITLTATVRPEFYVTIQDQDGVENVTYGTGFKNCYVDFGSSAIIAYTSFANPCGPPNGEWLNKSSGYIPGDYEIMCTQISGDAPQIGALDVWLSMNTSPRRFGYSTSSSTDVEGVFQYTMREVANPSNFEVATISHHISRTPKLTLNQIDGTVNKMIKIVSAQVEAQIVFDGINTRDIDYKQGSVGLQPHWVDLLPTPPDDWEIMVSLNSGDPLQSGILDTWTDLLAASALVWKNRSDVIGVTKTSVLDIQIRQKSVPSNIDTAQVTLIADYQLPQVTIGQYDPVTAISHDDAAASYLECSIDYAPSGGGSGYGFTAVGQGNRTVFPPFGYWISANDFADPYEIRATVVSGKALDVGTQDAWLALDAQTLFGIRNSAIDTLEEAELLIEIRHNTTPGIIEGAMQITLISDRRDNCVSAQ